MDFFFHSELTAQNREIRLSPSESQHLSRVLRKQVGDTVGILNGVGGRASGSISYLDPKGSIVTLLEFEQFSPPAYTIHIAIAPTKSIDRFKWFLEKATEIGVSTITPIICQNSERRNIKWERLDKIVLSATKQSHQVYRPVLNPLTPFNKFINEHPKSLIAHCREGKKINLLNHSNSIPHSTILIGPEGDFTKEEIEMALVNQAQTISLGKQRFRTETAGIIACHTVAVNATLVKN